MCVAQQVGNKSGSLGQILLPARESAEPSQLACHPIETSSQTALQLPPSPSIQSSKLSTSNIQNSLYDGATSTSTNTTRSDQTTENFPLSLDESFDGHGQGRPGIKMHDNGLTLMESAPLLGASKENSQPQSATELLAEVSGGILSKQSADIRNRTVAAASESELSSKGDASNQKETFAGLQTNAAASEIEVHELCNGPIYPPRFKIDFKRSRADAGDTKETYQDNVNLLLIDDGTGDQTFLLAKEPILANSSRNKMRAKENSHPGSKENVDETVQVSSRATTLFSVPMQLHLPSTFLELPKENAFLGGVCTNISRLLLLGRLRNME